MSKISRQQLSKGILDALASVGGGGGAVYYGDTEPLIAGEGSIWMETEPKLDSEEGEGDL